MDFSKKIKAIELRRKGFSYSEIRQSINNVSKSTLSKWLKNIELTTEQKKRLTRLQATAYLGAKKIQARSIAYHNQIRESAKKEVLTRLGNPLFLAGLMLYWAEGDKRSGEVQFTNSDPDMITLMMRWFREFCNIPESKFRIGLFVHSLHVKENYLDFWSKATSVPLTQFNKPYIKPTIFSNRKNKLYEGTCVIKIHSRDLISKILGWIDGIKDILKNYA
ncbi:MAG: hypothetical protein DRP74_05640 [Candidatus Omnitrophota bacterium]|nr:MAG: hypothetical protein DRP74_05640 [Candidatus Omnitrophota bacterium]